MKKLSPFIFGLVALTIMGGFYYLILLATTGDPLHPFIFFVEKWPLLSLLFLSFFGNMFYLRKLRMVQESGIGASGSATAINGVSMVACCAHHIADLFPVLGLFSIAAFLTDYQDYFLALGTVSNLLAIIYLRYHLNKSCQKQN